MSKFKNIYGIELWHEFSLNDQKAMANVYNNDFLMDKIISKLTTFHDRLKLDQVSLRFQTLVRESKWENLNPIFEKLVIFAPGGDVHVAVSLGYFRKNIKSVDFSYELMTILWKLLMFKRNVKCVEYGTVGNESLTFTRELMEYLDNFKHLKSLVLKFYETKQDAIDYLASDECQFKHRIENLSIYDMNYSTWITHLINSKLRTLSICIRDFPFASVLLNRINQLDLHLDTINIQVADLGMGDIRQQIGVFNGLSKRCDNFNLFFFKNLRLATNIALWKNVTSLTISILVTHWPNDLPMVYENIKHLTSLEHLKINQKISRAAFISLRKGIQGLTKLKYLNISYNSSSKEFGIIEPFFEILPLSLEEIQLDQFIWEDGAIRKFCQRSFKNLKKLTILQPHRFGRQGSRLFDSLITRFRSLEKFHFSNNINVNSVNRVIDHPKLNDAIINVWRDLPMDMQMALRRKFNNYRCFRGSESVYLHLSK